MRESQRRLIELWHGSAQRQHAAEVARAANDKLFRLGGAVAQFPFCPALAMEASGAPLALPDDFLRQAEAAASLRPAAAAAHPLEAAAPRRD